MTTGGLPALLRGYPLRGFERSVKLRRGALCARRCLFGFGRASIPLADLPGLGEQLSMPVAYVGEIASRWAAADAIHFGYESSGAGECYKLYLEFSRQLELAGDRPVLLHQAWKWVVGDARERQPDRYFCHPRLPFAAIAQRIAALYAGLGETPSLVAARAVVDLAAQRSATPPMYLEVVEPGSARASFDLRLYDSGLLPGEIDGTLHGAAQRYGVGDEFADVLAGLRGATPGHLAGGIDREGRDFLTFYYSGAKPAVERQTNFERSA